jgi:hypothetical protein
VGGNKQNNNLLFSEKKILIDCCTFLPYMFRISFWTSGEVYFGILFLKAFSSTNFVTQSQKLEHLKKITSS